MVRSTTRAFVLFLLSTGIIHAQAPNKVTQATEWYAINSVLHFSKRINAVVDGQFRFVDKMAPMQHMLRGGIEIEVVKGLSVVPLGYCYVWNYRYGDQPATFANNEYRFWHQVQYKHKAGKLGIGHRLRFEERSIQRHHNSSETPASIIDDGYNNHQSRLRYRLNILYPISEKGANGQQLFLNVWDEVHFTQGAAVKSVQPNQNRVFLGTQYQFSKLASIQVGFIYQLLKKDNGIQQENNMGGMVQLNWGFDFRKAQGLK